MKLWRDKDWIWFTNDSGMTGTFHIDYLPWMNQTIPRLVSGEIESDEFTIPDDEEIKDRPAFPPYKGLQDTSNDH